MLDRCNHLRSRRSRRSCGMICTVILMYSADTQVFVPWMCWLFSSCDAKRKHTEDLADRQRGDAGWYPFGQGFSYREPAATGCGVEASDFGRCRGFYFGNEKRRVRVLSSHLSWESSHSKPFGVTRVGESAGITHTTESQHKNKEFFFVNFCTLYDTSSYFTPAVGGDE